MASTSARANNHDAQPDRRNMVPLPALHLAYFPLKAQPRCSPGSNILKRLKTPTL